MRAFLFAMALLGAAASAQTPHQVTSLPGFSGTLPGRLYSGYLPVDAASGRRLFYMFMESATDPANADVAAWWTGGPGCSSMLGFFTESGPFRVGPPATAGDATPTILLNPHSWVYANASVLAIESPAGVGFSSSNDTADYTTGDKRTADDAYNALQAFYKMFPHLQKNKLWITGESYGGHYVPELSYRIVQGNAALAPGDVTLNIAGWMVGDPWTDPPTEAPIIVKNWYDRATISEATFAQVSEFCTWRDITFWIVNNVTVGAPLRSEADRGIVWKRVIEEAGRLGQLTPQSDLCFKALVKTSQEAFDHINILNMEQDVCVPGAQTFPHAVNPCIVNQLQTWMNVPNVQAALGVSAPINGGSWQPCTTNVHYSTNDTQTSVVGIYRYILQNTDLKVLVYSGTSDLIIPTVSTRAWVKELAAVMDYAEVNPFHPWYSDSNGQQLAGWATQYSRFTFTSIRGAGHLVPYSQPERGFEMFKRFKQNGKL